MEKLSALRVSYIYSKHMNFAVSAKFCAEIYLQPNILSRAIMHLFFNLVIYDRFFRAELIFRTCFLI